MPLVRSNGFLAELVRSPHRLCPPFVYAIWDGEAVKIGTSKVQPRSRMADLQTGNSRQLVLLAYTASATEREVHRRLARWRLRGEWFGPAPEVLSELRNWDWLDEGAVAAVAAAG
jgi:hypothetical protein